MSEINHAINWQRSTTGPSCRATTRTSCAASLVSLEPLRDEASERLDLVLAALGAAYWDWDLRSGKLTLSPQWKAMRGYAAHESSDGESEWKRHIHPEDAPRVQNALRAHWEGNSAVYAEEYRSSRKDGSWLWVAESGQALRGPEGRAYRMIATQLDITARKQAEQEDREREARLGAILLTVADAVVTIDHSSVIVSANPAAERMFGYEAAEMLGKDVRLLMPPSYRSKHRGYVSKCRSTGEVRPISGGREVQGRRKDGSVFPIEVTVSAIPQMGLFTGVIRDISGRKALESEVLRACEAERERVAADLHDGIYQELVAASCAAKGLANQLQKQGSPHASPAGNLADALSQTAAHTRALARGMNPVVAGGYGLVDALEELAQRASQTHPCHCVFTRPQPVPTLDPFTSKQLLLIAQEAVCNAVRHSKGKRIDIELSETGSEVRIAVRDDGCGLPSGAENSPGLGLRAMKYRAGLIQGHLSIEQPEGGGTQVVCLLIGSKPRRKRSPSPRKRQTTCRPSP